MDVQTLDARVGSKTGLEKNSVLDELSNLSNFAQNAKPVEETALDDLSNKSSNLDAEPSTTGVVENALEAKEAIEDLAGMLEICSSKEMLAELRSTNGFTPSVLNKASKRLSADKRNQIKEWVFQLNNQAEQQQLHTNELSPDWRSQDASGRMRRRE